jgi:hypothetical protein
MNPLNLTLLEELRGLPKHQTGLYTSAQYCIGILRYESIRLRREPSNLIPFFSKLGKRAFGKP